MMTFLLQIDHWLFRLINGLHHPFLDEIMWIFSQRFYWIPLYALLLFLIIKKYRKASAVIIFALIVTIVLSDQISVLIKDNVMRLRPSHNPDYENVIHLVHEYKGGTYGFVSSHAANVSAFVTYLLLIPVFQKKRYWYLLVLWAFLVSYSRIYLGVHYPADIAGGIMIGILIGWGTSYVIKNVYLKKISNLKI